MAPTATLLGQAQSDTANSVTITLGAAQPADSIVQLFPAAVNTQVDGSANFYVVDSVSDSLGGTWLIDGGTGGTSISVGEAVPAIGTQPTKLQLSNSCIRTAGGLLGIGDTVTVTWDRPAATPPDILQVLAMLFAITEIVNTRVAQTIGGTPYAFGYGNMDGYPIFSADPSTLNWGTDLDTVPAPVSSCLFIGATAFWISGGGIGGWDPVTGTVIGEYAMADADSSIALSVYMGLVSGGVDTEPGGTLGADTVELICGNYQFATLTDVPPPEDVGYHVAHRFNVDLKAEGGSPAEETAFTVSQHFSP